MDQTKLLELTRQRMKARGIGSDDVDALIDELPDAQLQAYLNGLSVEKAKRHAKALRRMVRERPGVEYIGLESFSAAYTGHTSVDLSGWNNNSVRYTTKHFHATATTYAIVPSTARYDIGFIQTCEARRQVQTYRDDGLNTRWEAAHAFPLSDSSSNGNVPWYHVGRGNNCANQTAERAAILAEQETFELDDNFNQIGSNARLAYVKGGQQARTPIARIRRQQTFRMWFAVKRTNSSTYRLLKMADYGFDLAIGFKYTGGYPGATLQERVVNIASSDPGPDAGLPRHALSPPTTNGVDRLNVYVGDQFKCSIQQNIVLP